MALVVALTTAASAFVVGSLGIGSVQIAAASTSSSQGCSKSAVAAPVNLRLTVVKSRHGKVPTIPVCLDGKGPYPFLISTGAGSSVVTPALAHRLRLRTGENASVRGVTCVATTTTAVVKSWSMSGLKLAAQSLVVSKVPRIRGSFPFAGIIGSDVLERFGAVRIDYRARLLKVRVEEGAAPKGNTYVLGQADTVPPSSLLSGRPKLSVPLRVFETPQGTIVAAPVKVGGHTEQLAVDSGSPGSGLVPGVVRSLNLKPDGPRTSYSGIGCKGKGATFSSGTWSLAGSSLRIVPLISRRIAGVVNSGLQGVLGSNVLDAHGAVVIDYAGAHLWLTSG